MKQNICTIYKITNKLDNKVYIGQTWETMRERFSRHCRRSNRCLYIGRAIQKHGKDNFYVESICCAADQLDADFWEQHFIRRYDSMNKDKGYNLKEGGSHGKLSEETKRKLSIIAIGREPSNKGTPMLEEQKQKISAAQKGRVFSDEQKKNMSEAHKGKTPPKAAIEASGKITKGKTWKLIDGKRVWLDRKTQ